MSKRQLKKQLAAVVDVEQRLTEFLAAGGRDKIGLLQTRVRRLKQAIENAVPDSCPAHIVHADNAYIKEQLRDIMDKIAAKTPPAATPPF